MREPEREADVILARFRGGDDDGVLDERLAAVQSLDGRQRLDDDARLRRALGEVMPYVLGRASSESVRTAVIEALATAEPDVDGSAS